MNGLKTIINEGELLYMLERIKPYKNADPLKTIQNIRRILFDNDIFVIEISQKKEKMTGVCSCRVILGDEGVRDLNIGTNGKGMNGRYALASAYAEFMERLQNGVLLWKILGAPRNLPKQSEIDAEKYRQAVNKILKFAYGDDDYTCVIDDILFDSDNTRVLKFYEYNTKNELLFPICLLNRMMGSNGMAAGNSYIEAIIQGVSEIFERQATQEIFLHECSIPQIDKKYFETTDVLSRLEKLENIGMHYKILDCSLGRGLPVVGLLFELNGKYHLHLGADPSPITALERCLTEAFQGRSVNELPLYPLLSAESNKNELFANEEKQYTDSTGWVPEWVVNNLTTKFCGFIHEKSVSDEDDMNYYLKIISNMKKKLYVSDMGILGFPTVRLYIPGITENHCPSVDYCSERKLSNKLVDYIKRLPLLNDEQFSELADEIILRYKIDDEYAIRTVISPNEFSDLIELMPPGLFTYKYMDYWLIVTAIIYRGGHFELGQKMFTNYIESLKISKETADMLLVRIKSKKLFFLPSEWPCCPECSTCKSERVCYKTDIQEFSKKINKMVL